MLERVRQLELTAKDFEMIEAALHTQQKILSVQSEAGGTGAREKLTDLKHLMQRIGRAGSPRKACTQSLWSYLTGSLFGIGRKGCHEQ